MKVILIVFNRPILTQVVMSRIIEADPEKLYVFADGPRLDKTEDVYKCEQVRNIVSNNINCTNIEVRFSERNLGALHSMKSALDWFFNYEDEGVIIEDDCLPDLSFFAFCEKLLRKYRHNNKIFMISGSNFVPNSSLGESYLFSRLALIWGWATWKNTWRTFDEGMKDWPNYIKSGDLDYFGHNRDLVFELINEQYIRAASRTWGVIWRATFLINRALSIVPKNNLVKNLGFGHPDATHQKSFHKVANIPVKPIQFPLVHPSNIVPDREYDEKALDFYYGQCKGVIS